MTAPHDFAPPQQNPQPPKTSGRKMGAVLLSIISVVVLAFTTAISYFLFSHLADRKLVVGNVDEARRIIERIETNYPYTSDNTDHQSYPDEQRTYYASSDKARNAFSALSGSSFYDGNLSYEEALSASGSYAYSFTTLNGKACTAQEMKNSSDPVLHYSFSLIENAPQYKISPSGPPAQDELQYVATVLDTYYNYDAILVEHSIDSLYEDHGWFYGHLLKNNTVTSFRVEYINSLVFIYADTMNLDTKEGLQKANENTGSVNMIREKIYNTSIFGVKGNYFRDIRKSADETLDYASAAKDLSDKELLALLAKAPIHYTYGMDWPATYTNGMANDTNGGFQVMTIDGQEVPESANSCPAETMESAKPIIVDFNNDGIRDIVTTPVHHPCGVGGASKVWYDAVNIIVVYTPTLDGKGLEILITGELRDKIYGKTDEIEELFLKNHPEAERNTSYGITHWLFREYNIEDKEDWCTEKATKESPEYCPKQTIDSSEPIIISVEKGEIKVNLLRGLMHEKPIEGEDYGFPEYSYKHYTGTFTRGEDGYLHLTDID